VPAGEEDPGPSNLPRAGLLFEGNFETAEIVSELEGAQSTQLVPAWEWDYGVRLYTRATWEEQGRDWTEFTAAAREIAHAIADRIEPRLVRDRRGVIDFAIVRDKDPFLGSILLSPRFRERFRDTLGDRLHVIILDRHELYVFPATGNRIAEYGATLVAKFRATSMPVSLEVFLVDKDGFRAIGELER